MYKNNAIALLLTLLLFSIPLRAQDYPFLHPEANRLRYDSTSSTMQAFMQKFHRLRTTGQGNVSIMHIGGSHVQAGTLPHRIRTNILTAYPTLVHGRGLLFPYSAAAKCNNPADYKVHCLEKVTLTRNVYKQPEYPLGLCGIAVTAHDIPTSIQILSNESTIDYGVSRIVVLGHTPDGIVPTLRYGEGNETLPSYIDSANHRYVYNLRHEVDSINIYIPCKSEQQFTLTGVLLDSRHPGITYHSIGVNGAAVPDYLKCNLTADLRLIRPDLVIFGIGINDAHAADFDSVAFKNNYLRLCDSIRSVNPQCAFIFITNNDCYRKTGRRKYTVNHNGLQVQQVCYRLAQLTGGAVWDQFEIMGGLKSMEKWQKAGLAQKDKVHFTRTGYQLLGDLFYQALSHEIEHYQPAPLKDTQSKRHAVQQNSNGEKPLPRGLRRKPKTRQVSITPKPSAEHDTPATTPNENNSSRDRFPYIPD
jgi:lysophospholipase L1-like esterase